MIKMVDLHKQDGCIRNDIDKAIADAVDECAFIKGAEVGTFEAELAHYVNAKYCISCGNGTDAITLALMAVGLRPGDEVIVPAFSFAAAAEAVALLGGKPVFADIDPRTFNIDCESVERVVSKRTKAIIPVHLFGQPCNMTGLMKIASNTGIVLIEDNAQSLGAKCIFPDGSKQFAGTVGTIGCTSFFPSKILGCYGDGGAVFTDSRELAEKIKALASHGQSIKYRHEYIGLNSRLDTVQAAVLRVKLPHVDKWISHRRRAAANYNDMLSDLEMIGLPHEDSVGIHVYHQYTLTVPEDDRDKLRRRLLENGIESMVYYSEALHTQPAYSGVCSYDKEMLNAVRLPASVLSLPIYGNISDIDQEVIVDTIRKFYKHN